jgi:large subunit ribosomal protein L5
MQAIRIEKATLNFGSGADQKKLVKGIKLLKMVAGREPVKTLAKKRIPTWGSRPGLPIGAKLTLRGKDVAELLPRLIAAHDNILSQRNFDANGNVSLGIPEYVDVPGTKYDPELGIMGFEVSITLMRPGFRIKNRKIMKRRIPMQHRISQADAIAYFKEAFKIQIKEEEQSE